MRIDAALADELEPGQALEQATSDFRALTDEHHAFSILQARRERIRVLHVVVPDRDLMPFEPLERGKRAQRVEIIVQDGNLHAALRNMRRRSRSSPMIRPFIGVTESLSLQCWPFIPIRSCSALLTTTLMG